VAFSDVYIGELGRRGALDWGGDPKVSNTPKRIGPMFPHLPGFRGPWFKLNASIRDGILDGKQVDWGAIAARVTVPELRAFVHRCYGDDVAPQLAEFIAGLDPDRSYALVGTDL